ncbi:MAG: DnaJ subfamily er 11 [Chloroflexota bacterium]|jgi:curved DNA-binding protein CbpA|nr:DnaJ subfamily er 11 [Chloroflexota bacterium]
MPGILSRFIGGNKKLSLADRHRLMVQAIEMHDGGATFKDVEAELVSQGASKEEASRISAEAQVKAEAELIRRVPLPPSAQWAVNYYFVLGVTPRASSEQIHRAYRRKAKEVHPDRHDSEFTRESWSKLMALITDAHHVLNDPQTRRVYDAVWKERSRRVAADNRRAGELRGDWETRYRWELAELAEREDRMAAVLEQAAHGFDDAAAAAAARQELETAMEDYEGEILEIRTQTHALPAIFLQFGGTVRNEMQRKERLLAPLQSLSQNLESAASPEGAAALRPQIDAVYEALESVRRAQHNFDIAAARTII